MMNKNVADELVAISIRVDVVRIGVILHHKEQSIDFCSLQTPIHCHSVLRAHGVQSDEILDALPINERITTTIREDDTFCHQMTSVSID